MAANKRKILIADDNGSLRMVLQAALSDSYDVTAVGDGKAMAAELRINKYDLVISDLNLPYQPATRALRVTETAIIGKHQIDGFGVPTLIVTGMSEEDEEYKMARRMVNVIDVLSKPVDLFMLRRRVAEILKTSDAAANAAPMALPVPEPGKILIADDDPEVRKLLASVLEQRGFQTKACANLSETFRICKETDFDCILLDYVFEDGTAEDFLARVRAENVSAPPVLVVSGFADALPPERFRDYPAVKGIIAKPFDFAKLILAIRPYMPGETAVVPPSQTFSAAASQVCAHVVAPEAYDRQAVLEQVFGDEAMVAELQTSFLEDWPGMRKDLRKAVECRNGEAIEFMAHKINSSLTFFRAREASMSAKELERIGRVQSYEDLERQFAKLMEQMQRLEEAFAQDGVRS